MITKKRILIGLGVSVILIFCSIAYYYLDYYSLLPKKSYTAEQFKIKTVISTVDFNQNGVDDYTDLLLGAKEEGKNHSTYESSYYVGGYPPDDIGVCTDVIWRAFRHAGYSLKDMVNQDIKENPEEYKRIEGTADPNIDFRRVPNLKVYFERNAVALTSDTSKIEEWQPGDIVIFSTTHIGILSDLRNKEGVPYLIHNSRRPKREEDALLKMKKITGHYRFDASRLKKEQLIPFR